MAPQYGVSAELPSKEELAQIEQIRASCQKEIDALTVKADDVVGDLRVCRFLRSKDGNVKEATDWFREFLSWRTSCSVETDRAEVIGRSPEDFLAWWERRCNPYLPLCPYIGRNSDGHMIFSARPGMLHAKKFVSHRQHPMADDERALFQMLEWLLWYIDDLSRKEGRMVYVIKLADMRGLGDGGRPIPVFVSEFKSFFTGWMKMMQKFYCEHDSLFLIINTNMFFRVMFAVMKTILSKRQTSKIRVLGDSNQASVRATLMEYVPEEVLPAELGGKLQKARYPVYPLATEDRIEEWYQKRHLVTPEPVLGQDGSAAADVGRSDREPEPAEPRKEEASPISEVATTAAPSPEASPSSEAKSGAVVVEDKAASKSTSCFACTG